jgi:hypothetical protein
MNERPVAGRAPGLLGSEMTITIQIEEPSNIDLARLDDDGGNR